MRSFVTAALIVLAMPGAVVAQQRSISQSDKARGQQAHPQLLQTFGGAYGGPQDAYVARVGKRVAVQSGLSGSERDFTITLLNSSTNNAFAVPGGYVYITRQLLALLNDEAELAAVLGHEVGHVADRHASSRSRTSGVTSVLAGLLGAVTGSEGLGQLAGQAAQLYTLRFSRQQELSADDLGVRYLAGSGYSPFAMSTALASLADQNALDEAASGTRRATASWASTHPDPASRVVRARQAADRIGGAAAAPRNRAAFLAAIDGLTYGDDPRQGVVEGNSFQHPDMRIAFTAPPGFAMTNSADAVSVTGQGGQAQLATARYEGDLPRHVQQVMGGLTQGQAPALDIRRATVGGFDTAYATVRAASGNQPLDVTVFAFEASRTSAYHFIMLTPAGSGFNVFRPMIDSFRRLSSAEAARIRTREIDVVTVRPGDTAERLAATMAVPDRKLERFLVLNGLGRQTVLRPGTQVKLVIYRP